ncbi:MAG TPA: UvrD-helicase domain-containing protein [Acidimicrobiales bacterium]|jgi:DNA helicase II / ATP-dependent DNA helicase PcrA|nr:UvrD-helicase domain-containing protein [Acidimicrobiales bacterium]
MSDSLTSYAALVDEAVARACGATILERGAAWSGWEVAQGLEDLLALSSGRDCAYDRPSVATSYALWYHGARTHEALRALAPFVGATTESLRIIDIGCGTGATACAVAVLMTHLATSGHARPAEVIVEAADSSPFMVAMAERIFDELRSCLNSDQVSVSFKTASWTDLQLSAGAIRPLIVGGYLFDHSDHRHVDELAKRFVRLGDEVDATGAVLFTTSTKAHLLARAIAKLESLGWARTDVRLSEPPWGGPLPRCHEVRAKWYASAGTVRSQLYSRPPSWVSPSPPVVRAASRSGAVRDTLFDTGEASLLLDDEQDEAARPDDHPTVVVGAAGSGKSRVLAERVVRTLETARPSAARRILVTAFNKAMVDQLALWIEERIRASKILKGVAAAHRDSGWSVLDAWVGATQVSVMLINRDRLPNRVLGQTWPGMARAWSTVVHERKALAEAKLGVERVRQAERYLSPDFLDEELERVIYGRAALTWERYSDTSLPIRRGRLKPLRLEAREVVWTVLMEPPRPNSFVHRRINAYEAHRARVDAEQHLKLPGGWTHVFVDECQDFTESDFRVLACIPPDPQHLFVTGDESQSMHLGPCYRRPGLKRRQWKKHELGGSYRLPLRVCEALEGLALAFVDAHAGPTSDELDLVLPESRKAAVIGPRPIVLAGSESTLSTELRQVLDGYRPLYDGNPPLVSLAEADHLTEEALRDAAPWAEVEVAGMLRIKGLERSCVVFSDRAVIGGDESAPEWIYTALTRSTSVLIIVLWPDAADSTKAVLGRLHEGQLLFWTPAARAAFDEAKSLVGSDADPLRPVSTGD